MPDWIAVIDCAGLRPATGGRLETTSRPPTSPLGRVATSEDAAAAVAFLASPEAAYVTDAALLVDGGYLLR
ncbi:MAG TPA: SDR family oxidoreductase [Candidatus Limnocylindrales bacterium]